MANVKVGEVPTMLHKGRTGGCSVRAKVSSGGGSTTRRTAMRTYWNIKTGQRIDSPNPALARKLRQNKDWHYTEARKDFSMTTVQDMRFTRIDDRQAILEKDHGITIASLKTFEIYGDQIGDIHSVSIIQKGKNEPAWTTKVEGDIADLYLYGFSFGYGGEGPRGLLKLLERCKVEWTEEEELQILGCAPIGDRLQFTFYRIDARADVTERGETGIIRTAIRLQNQNGSSGGTTSLDVLAPDGELVCRLNIGHSSDDARWANVDICFGIAGRDARAIAFSEGREVLRFDAAENGSSLIAVDMRKI